uniref:Riboflavin transporter n=1 Tax=Bombyx mori TaxID=7091 RepID=A0A8R2LZR5_BOMMO|nr:solute carrier family 52, riboflavin transporter, member 3-B isoform X2 [Bombyx mori]
MPHVSRLNEDKEISPCLVKEEGFNVRMWGAQRRVTLDVLLICWGIGTWLGVNGLYVQLPLLVERLPEGWALPSSLVLAVQLANIGPILYGLLGRLRPHASDSPYIYGLLIVGTLSLIINAFVYDMTTVIGGADRSLPFLALVFGAALVGCTSSVLFYPYLRHFRDIYLATYLVGEGLSGFLPSILSLIQGVGGEPECLPSEDSTQLVPHYPPPLFSTTVFLVILGAMSAMSLISFFIINNYRVFDSEKVTQTVETKDENIVEERESLVAPKWVGVLVFMVLLNAVNNGLMPSIQSYSCMPYGTRAYHLAVTLGAMANPVACLAGVWLRPVGARVLAGMLLAALVPFVYMTVTALMSPAPPLQYDVIGEVLIVFSWVVVSGVVSYARMWVYGWVRRGGARGMRVCGAVTQLGSASGSAVMYFVVNFTKLFVQPDVCAPLST